MREDAFSNRHGFDRRIFFPSNTAVVVFNTAFVVSITGVFVSRTKHSASITRDFANILRLISRTKYPYRITVGAPELDGSHFEVAPALLATAVVKVPGA